MEQLPEQGYVQQAIRNDDRAGVRKRIGVIRRFFSARGRCTSKKPAISATLDGMVASESLEEPGEHAPVVK